MRSPFLYLWLSAFPLVPAGLSLAPAMTAEAPKDALYQEARKDLDAGRFNAAADKFGRSAVKDGARALEIDIRGDAGQHPDPTEEVDDETKLYALNGLMASGSKQAVPLLLKFLDGPHSARLKGQALSVLSQSDSPEARKVLLEVARGTRHPELQRQAIESLGAAGDDATLAEIYAAAAPPVKLAVLDAYMAANARDRIIAAARSEKDPAVRRKAIDLLGPIGAKQELRQLYRDGDAASRMQILDGLAVAGDVEALSGIARDEKEPGPLRRKAIEGLGTGNSQNATAALRSLYTGSADPGIRQAAIQGLFIQNNARALIELYRAEKDPRMRREIVQKLSLMRSPEAEEFLSKIFQ